MVARNRWGWQLLAGARALTTLFLVVDLAFFAANLLKIPQGGWFPLVVAGLVFIADDDLEKGRARLAAIVRENTLPMDLFLADIRRRQPHRVRGTAVFLTSDTDGRAAGAAASPQAQQGAAREGDADVDRDRGDPPGGRGRPGPVPGAGRGLLPGGGPLRLHGDAGRARRCSGRSARRAATGSRWR